MKKFLMVTVLISNFVFQPLWAQEKQELASILNSGLLFVRDPKRKRKGDFDREACYKFFQKNGNYWNSMKELIVVLGLVPDKFLSAKACRSSIILISADSAEDHEFHPLVFRDDFYALVKAAQKRSPLFTINHLAECPKSFLEALKGSLTSEFAFFNVDDDDGYMVHSDPKDDRIEDNWNAYASHHEQSPHSLIELILCVSDSDLSKKCFLYKNPDSEENTSPFALIHESFLESILVSSEMADRMIDIIQAAQETYKDESQKNLASLIDSFLKYPKGFWSAAAALLLEEAEAS